MKKVVLVGLGDVGLTYAVRLRDICDLSILVDKERLLKYKKNKFLFNDIEYEFNYILPEKKIHADLIIITTKFQHLSTVIKNIENFVTSNTRIISLINGISSEEVIAQAYPNAVVLKSYFIGHSAVREANSVHQDGVGEIVIEHDDFIEKFFSESEIKYSVPDDINYSMWLKYCFNLFSNQISAILNMDFGALKQNKAFKNFAKKIILEVSKIAECKGVKNVELLESDALKLLDRMCNEGKTSMHQDILAKRPTEVDIFAGEIIRLGVKYGIETPCNDVLYNLIKIKEEDNERSIHSC